MARHQLVQRIIDVLRSDPCKQINFTFAGIRVYGAGYQKIADRIASGQIQVAQSRVLPAAVAAYNKLYNALICGPAPKPDLIVHEATHALNDLHGRNVNKLDDEAAAFIASSMYLLRLRGRPLGAGARQNLRSGSVVAQSVCEMSPLGALASWAQSGFNPCHTATIAAASEIALVYMSNGLPTQEQIGRLRTVINRTPNYQGVEAGDRMRYDRIRRNVIPPAYLRRTGSVTLSHR